MITLPESGGHWYDPVTSEPRHTVIGKTTGKPRHTTVADARKEGWVPSVTQILKVIAKEQLVTWRISQGIMAALTLPQLPGESADAFAKRVVEDMNAQSNKALDVGSLIHNACESYLQGRKPSLGSYEPLFVPVKEWLDKNVEEVYFVETVLVNPAIGYAGTVDLIADVRDVGLVIGDFKTQAVKRNPKGVLTPVFYDEWALQLAAYANAHKPHTLPQLLSIVISTSEPMEVAHKVWDDPDKHYKAFLAAHALFCWQKDFYPVVTTK